MVPAAPVPHVCRPRAARSWWGRALERALAPLASIATLGAALAVVAVALLGYQLPTNRTSASTVAEHVADHDELHRLHNQLDGLNILSAKRFGAVGDVRQMDVTTAAGSDVLTLRGSWPATIGAFGYPAHLSTPAAWTDADEGKKFAVRGAGAAGGPLVGTFLQLLTPTTMKMSVTAGTTVVGTPGESYNSNYPSANFGTDDSAAIQAAIDAAAAQVSAGSMAGGYVLLPAGAYYAKGIVLKTGVRLVADSLASQLWASPDSGSTAVLSLGNPQSVAKASSYRSSLEGVAIYGQGAMGVTGRCIDFTVNSEVWQNFQGGGPNDANHTIRDVYVHDSGADVAVFVGINVRGLYVSNLRIMVSGYSGMTVATTDAFYESLSIGGGGTREAGSTARWALKVTGANNRFTNGKFWYPVCTNGDGVYIAAKGSWFSNCETQDNSRYGWVIDNVHGVTLDGCSAGGDLVGSLLLLGPVQFARIDLQIVVADRWQTKAGAIVDGTGGSPAGNIIRLLSEPLVLDATYKQLVSQNGGTFAGNTIWSQGLKGQQGWFTGPAAGNFAPDFPTGGPLAIVLLTQNITVIQVLNPQTVAPGAEVTFMFLQDATGGRTVAWNAVWGTNVPAVSGVANAVTIIKFVAWGGSLTAPSWQHL